MIIIEDNDLPIVAAAKLIQGTRPYTGNTPALGKAIGSVNEDEDGNYTIDQFDIGELREIASYLTTYCDSHADYDG